jgi:CheY-like chemotaxis protein
LEQKGLNLSIRIDQNVPRYAVVDSARLRQVLVNLLGNAVKFTDSGSVELSLEFEAIDGAAGAFTFSILDTGIGIGEGERRRIFEPFYQVDSSVTRRYGGTGLGLPICDALLRMMGGLLEIESAPGEGSRFFFTVRMEYESVGQTEAFLKEARDELPHSKFFSPVSTGAAPVILIVDDKRLDRKLLRLMVSKLLPSAEVIEAENGAQGVEFFQNYAPTLVFMDIQMPEKDGFRTAKEILEIERVRTVERRKGEESRMSIVALNGEDRPETRDACLASGMDYVLTKPLEPQNVQRILEQYLKSEQ